MSQLAKLLRAILSGTADANVAFAELRKLLKVFGFAERIADSHHIFSRTGVDEIINLQAKGAKAKPYQVKQVRNLILVLGMQPEDRLPRVHSFSGA